MVSKFTLFVENNYTLEACKTIGPYETTVVIYRANCIKDIPEGLADYLFEYAPYLFLSSGRGRKMYGDSCICDTGKFLMTKDVVFDKYGFPTLVKVFITAVLKSPFGEEQQKYFESLQGLPPKKRAFLPWNSTESAKV